MTTPAEMAECAAEEDREKIEYLYLAQFVEDGHRALRVLLRRQYGSGGPSGPAAADDFERAFVEQLGREAAKAYAEASPTVMTAAVRQARRVYLGLSDETGETESGP